MSEAGRTREEAAVENSQLSTGPQTAAGKAVSAGNAIKHGLRARRIVMPDEDAGEFEAFRGELMAEYAPAGRKESDLVEAIAGLRWKKARADRLEEEFWARGYRPDAAGHVSESPLADTFIAHVKEFGLLLRYQGKIARELAGAKRELKELQAERAEAEGLAARLVKREAERAVAREAGPATERGEASGAVGGGAGGMTAFQERAAAVLARLEAEQDRREGLGALAGGANGAGGGKPVGARAKPVAAARNSQFIPSGGRR